MLYTIGLNFAQVGQINRDLEEVHEVATPLLDLTGKSAAWPPSRHALGANETPRRLKQESDSG
jgi:hypothetical protein